MNNEDLSSLSLNETKASMGDNAIASILEDYERLTSDSSDISQE